MASKAQAQKPNPVSTAQPKQEVITREESSKAVTQRQAANLPAHIKQSTKGRGSENVEMADVVIPRIEVVQALSPCLKKNDAAYIEGAEQGMLFNSVTRELYGSHVQVVPVFFKKQYLVWKDRKQGGGFGGAYDDVVQAAERIKQEKTEEQKFWAPAETAQQLVIVVKADGTTEEAVVSMSRTKLKISRQWNSLIRLNGNDRFSRTYTLFATDEQNSAGEDYKNFAVANSGFPDEETYKKAETLYAAIASGERRVVVDVDTGDQEGSPAPTEY